ncbi:MAG: zinc ribbon domain-containing protein [Gaiellaceae bacterium]
MSARADVEEIQVTRTEKLLAVVLTAFLLIGGIWTYTRIDDVIRAHVRVPTAALAADPAVARENSAQQRVFRAEGRSRTALQTLDVRREAYRTALEAKKSSTRLEREYNAAQAAYDAAQRELASARAEQRAAAPAATAAQRRAQAKVDAAVHRQERDAFLLRLALVVVSILFAYWLLAALRRRQTRWFPLAGSVVGFATIFAFVLAADYLTDYFDPFQWGVAVVALIGIAATLVAYLVLQRYLLRRVPQRRVRRRECPFCGYPVDANTHCEGCGREVLAPCVRCEAPRRVGTLHCGACGATS